MAWFKRKLPEIAKKEHAQTPVVRNPAPVFDGQAERDALLRIIQSANARGDYAAAANAINAHRQLLAERRAIAEELEAAAEATRRAEEAEKNSRKK